MKKMLFICFCLFFASNLFAFAAIEQKTLCQSKAGEEIYDADYEKISGKLFPKLIVTDKKIEIYKQNKLTKRIIPSNPFPNSKVIVRVSPDYKYFAEGKAIERDENKGIGTLAEYNVYDGLGKLLWSVKTDQYIFSEPVFTSYNNGTLYFSHPGSNKLGIMKQNQVKTISFEGYIQNIIPLKNDNLFLMTYKDSDWQDPWIEKNELGVILINPDGKIIWSKKFSINSHPSPQLITDDFENLLIYSKEKQNIFIRLNSNGDVINKYEISVDSSYYAGTIMNGQVYIGYGNKIQSISEKSEKNKIIEIIGNVKYINNGYGKLFVWSYDKDIKGTRRFYITILDKNLSKIAMEEVKLLFNEIRPPHIKIKENFAILVFPKQVIYIGI